MKRRLPVRPVEDRDPIVEQHFHVAMRYLAGMVWLVGAEREALLALRTLVDRRIGAAGEDPAEPGAEPGRGATPAGP